MQVKVTMNKEELVKLVIQHLQSELGSLDFKPIEVRIETKSLQNYKSEWEIADFRATYEGKV